MQLRKWTPTVILVVILLAGGAYAYSQNFFQKDESVPAEVKWVSASSDAIQNIEIQSSSASEEATEPPTTSESIVLNHKQGQWQMTAPAAYPVNTYAIEDWLTTLQSATVHAIVENEPTDVAKYGINLQKPTITLTYSDGTQNKIYIGSKIPIDGYYYARLNQEAVIQLAEQTVTDLSATVFGFVDTTPIGWDDQYLTQLIWQSQSSTNRWTLQHQANIEDPTQDQWTFNNHSVTSEQATTITDAIKNIPTDQLPEPAAQVKSDTLLFTLKVTRTEGEHTVTDTYQGFQSADEPDYIQVIDPSHQWAYRLPAEAIETITRSAQSISKM